MIESVRALASEPVLASAISLILWFPLMRWAAKLWDSPAKPAGRWWVAATVIATGAALHAIIIAVSEDSSLWQASTLLNPFYLEPSGRAWFLWLPIALTVLCVDLRPWRLKLPWLFIPLAVALLFAVWFTPTRILAVIGRSIIYARISYFVVTLLPLLAAGLLVLARVSRGPLRMAFVVLLVVLAEPIAFVASSPVTVGSTYYADLLKPGPDLTTAAALEIQSDHPEAVARVAHHELYGLFRTVDLAAWGGCFRVLSLRTPTGWKNIHWACFCV